MRKRIKIIVDCFNNVCKYEGFDGEQKIFQNTFTDTTLGVTEFVGAIHGLMWIKKNSNQEGDVLIENKYIKESIENKKYNHKTRGEKANEYLSRCKSWLHDQRSGINVELIKKE